MGFVPFDNMAQVELRFVQEGQQVENVFHVRQLGPFDVAALTAAAQAFATWWTTSMDTYVASAVSLNEIVARGMESVTDPAISFVTGLPAIGASASGGLPNNVTAAVKWTTALAGRSYRGRTYHVGLTEAQVGGSTIDATVRTNLQGVYNTLITDLDAAGFTLVVASRISGGVERLAGVGTTILAAVLDSTTDSQRRRLPGRGQ